MMCGPQINKNGTLSVCLECKKVGHEIFWYHFGSEGIECELPSVRPARAEAAIGSYLAETNEHPVTQILSRDSYKLDSTGHSRGKTRCE